VLNRPVLLYDGECGLCRRWVERLGRWDRAGAIDRVPFQRRAERPELPRIADAALERAMHLVLPGGEVLPGSHALPVLLGVVPGGRLLRALLRLPGAGLLADRAYRWVAARRHRLGCSSAACRARAG
jgi:predicted DCC family thiol-disulfide oxidoreductase YuxK